MAEEASTYDGTQKTQHCGGHIETMMLTSPLKASDCGTHKHSVQMQYLCYNLEKEADNICKQQGLPHSQQN